MEIMKVFSSYDDYGYEEERLYSVLMDENELALFSEIQKEYSVSKVGNFLRKAKRNLKMAGEEASLGKALMTGGDLTAKQTNAFHRNQRLALMKNKTVVGRDGFGNIVHGKARDIIPKNSIDVFRQAERTGNGMETGIFGYIPKK